MLDKTRLGTRYTCYECGTKFYDLNRPAPICPECGADQTNAPVQDVKALLSKGGGKRRKVEAEEEPAPQLEEEVEDGDDDEEEGINLGLGNDDDDDLE
ncbi:MAG: TIGR02300 family protein [Myxococcota bacterium]